MTRIRKALVWLLIGALCLLLMIASLPFMVLVAPVLLLAGLIFVLMPDEPEQEACDSALQPRQAQHDLLRVTRRMRTLDR